MNVQQMSFSEATLGKLSQLALAVELHESQRFRLNKDFEAIVTMLKVAIASGNKVVQAKLSDVAESLSGDTLGFFQTVGVDFANLPARTSKLTYRGQALDTPSKSAKASGVQISDESSEPTKKKKIIYRGKVLYR